MRAQLLVIAAVAFVAQGCNCQKPVCTDGPTCLPDGGFIDGGDNGNCPTDCSGALSHCTPNNGALSCVECVSDADCAAPTNTCDQATHSCIWVGRPPSAVTGTNGGSGTCAAPYVLNFVNDRAVAEGDNLSAVNNSLLPNNVQPSYPRCSLEARKYGPDVIYQYTLTEASDVTINVTPTSGNLNPVLYVKLPGKCDQHEETDFVVGPPVTIADGGMRPGEPECSAPFNMQRATLHLFNQPPGDYYAWVDSSRDNLADTRGGFVIDVTRSKATGTATNDRCESAIVVPKLPAVFSGQQLTASDNDVGTCGGTQLSDGADVAYQFTITEPTGLSIEVIPSALTPDFVPYLYVRDSLDKCNRLSNLSGLDYACVQGHRGTPTRLDITQMNPGTYYLIIDGVSEEVFVEAARGVYTVKMTPQPLPTAPANQSCNAAGELTFDSNGVAKLYGSTFAANDNTTIESGGVNSPCRPSAGSDVVYKFNPNQLGATGNQTVTAKVIITTLNRNEYMPRGFLRQSCGSTAIADNRCFGWNADSWTEARVMESGLTPNTDYYVWVDAASQDRIRGPYSLEVQAAVAPAANDTCAGATPIAVNSTVVGNSLGGTNDYSQNNMYYGGANCNTTAGMQGVDVVYSLTPPRDGPVTVNIYPDRTYAASLAVLRACAPSSCVAMFRTRALDLGVAGGLTFNATKDTTYYIIVDSEHLPEEPPHGAGTFKLQIEMP